MGTSNVPIIAIVALAALVVAGCLDENQAESDTDFVMKEIPPGSLFVEAPEIRADNPIGSEPIDNMVPDAETAFRLAYSILSAYYGKDEIDRQIPFLINNVEGTWVVQGAFPRGLGGNAEIRIRRKDGAVVYMSHSL